jgi:hypothetical protein
MTEGHKMILKLQKLSERKLLWERKRGYRNRKLSFSEPQDLKCGRGASMKGWLLHLHDYMHRLHMRNLYKNLSTT